LLQVNRDSLKSSLNAVDAVKSYNSSSHVEDLPHDYLLASSQDETTQCVDDMTFEDTPISQADVTQCHDDMTFEDAPISQADVTKCHDDMTFEDAQISQADVTQCHDDMTFEDGPIHDDTTKYHDDVRRSFFPDRQVIFSLLLGTYP
jgi:hypothetical protein